MAASKNFVKAVFYHEESEKFKCLSSSSVQRDARHSLNWDECKLSNYDTTQWEVTYKDTYSGDPLKRKSLHLSLLDGAASAKLLYLVYVEYYYEAQKKETAFSSGLATVQKGYSVDLKMGFRESKKMQYLPKAQTSIEFYILRLNPVVEIPVVEIPVVEIPERSTLSAVLSSTLTDEGLNDVMLYFGPEKELMQASLWLDRPFLRKCLKQI